eukprot:s5707_g2.t6
MFWDLNVVWDAKRAAAFADTALRFGYAGLAYNVTLSGQQVLDLRSHQRWGPSLDRNLSALWAQNEPLSLSGGMAEAEAAELSGDRAVSLLREPQGDILASVRVLKVFKSGPVQESGFSASLPDYGEQLIQLDIGGNPLQSFPDVCSLPKLEILFASNVGVQA